jgi:hypothetical protein
VTSRRSHAGIGVSGHATKNCFFQPLRETLRRIEGAPRSFPVVMEDVGACKARVLRTDYSVAFILTREGDAEIVAIAHGSRAPGWWKRRIREQATRGR